MKRQNLLNIMKPRFFWKQIPSINYYEQRNKVNYLRPSRHGYKHGIVWKNKLIIIIKY